jgi:phosphoserine aminotransferase
MTSCLLTEPVNIKDYGLIFAGAQKNISIPGLTIVIIRESIFANAHNKTIPTIMDYRTHIDCKSLYSTPPVFSVYLAEKMFQWIKEQGGIEELYKINCKKARILYQYIDESDFYQCGISKKSRSIVNVCFQLVNSNLEEDFIKQAESQGLLALKGHSSIGGLRASIYNAMPIEGVEALIKFMHDFSMENK